MAAVDLSGVRLPALLTSSANGDHPVTPAPRAGAAGTLAGVLRTLHRLPKVELHLHLEGTLRPESVCAMVARHDPTSPFCRPGWHVGHWTFRDLNGFVGQMRPVWRAAVRGPDDYYRLAYECFEDLAAQHVVYAEPSFGWIEPRLGGGESLAAIEQARRDAEARWPLRLGLVVGLARNRLAELGDDGSHLAVEIVAAALRARDGGTAIVGIDLHGDEQVAPQVEPFVRAFETAAEGGLGRRAHAGEGAGAQVVRQSVELLGVQRIGHGARAVEDPTLLPELARRGVALDVCPTSNVLIGCAPSIERHPIRTFLDAGIPVTVSSDDPLVFDSTVTAELALLHLRRGLTLAELGALQATAAAHAFLPADERTALAARISVPWRQASGHARGAREGADPEAGSGGPAAPGLQPAGGRGSA